MNELMRTATRLCDMRGCSGFEAEVRAEIRRLAAPHAKSMMEDSLGNLMVLVQGRERRPAPVVLCAHTDEVGAIVFRVSKDGLLYMRPVGYMDPRVFLGKRVRIGCRGLHGVVGTKAIQLCTEVEKRRAPGMTDMFIDIGARDREDALRYVQVGDPVAFEGGAREFGDRRFMAKAIDDRLLCAILLHVMECPLSWDTWFVFSACEEDGLRGASAMTERLRPKYAMVLEGTTAADFPGVAPHLASTRQGAGTVISLVDRGTFYNEEMIRRMTAAAAAHDIQWQYRTTINGRTDSGAISIRSGGVVTFGVSLATRYGHSQVSHVYWPDVEQVAAMTKLFIEETGRWGQ